MSTYDEKQNCLTKKAEKNNCNTYEVATKEVTPQPHNLKYQEMEHGRHLYNFRDLNIHNPTTTKSEGALISQLGRSNDGKALDNKTRTNMENDLGYNFGPIRIHTDNYATDLTKTLNAKATCYGQDIYFGKNQYNPNTKEGTNLLKHELNHYQQQNTTGTKMIQNQEETNTESQPQEIAEPEQQINTLIGQELITTISDPSNISKIIDTVLKNIENTPQQNPPTTLPQQQNPSTSKQDSTKNSHPSNTGGDVPMKVSMPPKKEPDTSLSAIKELVAEMTSPRLSLINENRFALSFGVDLMVDPNWSKLSTYFSSPYLSGNWNNSGKTSGNFKLRFDAIKLSIKDSLEVEILPRINFGVNIKGVNIPFTTSFDIYTEIPTGTHKGNTNWGVKLKIGYTF